MVEKYVSFSYSFVKFEIGSVFLDGSPYPSDERTAKVGKTVIMNKGQRRKNYEGKRVAHLAGEPPANQTNVSFIEPTFSPKNILA